MTVKLLQVDETIYLEHLKDFMNKYNIFCFLALSETFTLKLLYKHVVSVIKNNFVVFSRTVGLRNIDYKTLKFFVSSSTLHISSEIEVFQTIVN